MRLSVCLDSGRSWSDTAVLARHAEAAGLDGVWVSDHFMPQTADDRPAPGPVLEGWTTLTALAVLTTRVRLGTLVLGATYRHPAVVANMAATLDHVSDGRLTLGLGAGWQRNEHTAYGIELPEPGPRLAAFEEACAAIRSLLREPLTTTDGPVHRLRDARCEPKPVQDPLPILVGGGGEQRTMRVAARYAEGWHVWGSPEEFAAKCRVLDERCAEIGRDPATLQRVTGAVVEPSEAADPDALTRLLAGYAAAGADEFVIRDPRHLPPDRTAETLVRARAAVDRL